VTRWLSTLCRGVTAGAGGWRSEIGCFRRAAPIRGQAGFLDHEETVKGKTLFAREVYPRLKELPESG